MNDGKGAYYWPNGQKFIGSFLKDRIYGKGTLYIKDEKLGRKKI